LSAISILLFWKEARTTPRASRSKADVAVKLFSKPDLQYFDVAPDGEHFVLIESPEPTTETSLGVVVNWFARLSPAAAQAGSR
jgi:hypothetical protein